MFLTYPKPTPSSFVPNNYTTNNHLFVPRYHRNGFFFQFHLTYRHEQYHTDEVSHQSEKSEWYQRIFDAHVEITNLVLEFA